MRESEIPFRPGMPFRLDHRASVDAANLPFQTVAEVNESFYASYLRDYFDIELHSALALIASPRQALAPLIEGATFQDHADSYLLQIQIDEPDPDDKSVVGAARVRVAELFYHSLETFLRLYLAHGPDADVPWFAVSREINFRKFKDKVAKLAAIPTALTESSEIDEALRHVFLPVRELTDEQTQALRRTRAWVVFAATELLDTYAYNAFKHGLALHEGDEKLAIYSPEQDPRVNADGQAFVGGEGPALIYLSREPVGEQEYEWVRHSRFLHLSEKASFVKTMARLIRTCLDVGKARHVTRELKDEIWLPPYLPSDIIAGARRGEVHMEGMSMPLGFIEKRG